MAKPSAGTPAPEFSRPASKGQIISLKDFKGKKNVVIYFYPKDDTPGCTLEACGFRDTIRDIEKTDTIIFGVSPDKISAHEKFIKKFNLPFLLLSDEDHSMSLDYGVWVEKSMYGRKYMGIERTTFVINKAGKIVEVFEKVKPQGHNRKILDVLQTLE